MSRSLLPLLLGLTLSVPPIAAQDGPRWNPPEGVGEVAFLGLNTLVGGLTGGITRALGGGSFSDGFVRGMLGGTVHYAGKHIAAGRFWGAGLIGRQVGAVGTSMVVNAGQGVGWFDQVTLPVGPAWLTIAPGGGAPLRATIDASQVGWLVYAVASPDLAFDVDRSFSAGAFVFEAPHRTITSYGEPVLGIAGAGTILLSGRGGVPPSTVSHEQVHVVQFDFQSRAWARPVERWIIDRVGLDFVPSFIDFNVVRGLYRSAENEIFGREWTWEELEADFLEFR